MNDEFAMLHDEEGVWFGVMEVSEFLQKRRQFRLPVEAKFSARIGVPSERVPERFVEFQWRYWEECDGNPRCEQRLCMIKGNPVDLSRISRVIIKGSICRLDKPMELCNT